MSLHQLLHRLLRRLIILRRRPDVVIGERLDPYLLRWHVIPRNRWFNIYLHSILRSDDDRALHDHPWASISMLLHGQLDEVYAERDASGITHQYLQPMPIGRWYYRSARYAHRLVVNPAYPAITLFITGPVRREWGFHCPHGWVHWQDFTDPATHGSTIGRGCGEPNWPNPNTGD